MKNKIDFTTQTFSALQLRHKELCEEIFAIQNEKAMTRKIKKPHLLRAKKRDRARVLTFIRQKSTPQT